jgi:hypothetical protein
LSAIGQQARGVAIDLLENVYSTWVARLGSRDQLARHLLEGGE